MKALAAVVWCEWLSRKSWFLLAGMIGILILFAPLLSGPGLSPIEALVVGISAVFFVGVPAFSVAAGLSLNLRDLNEQRRGFFLAKPLPGVLLWAGKFLAGVGLIVILMVLLVLPGTMAVGLMWSMTDASLDGAPMLEKLSETLSEPEVSETVKLLSRATRIGLASFPAIFVVAFWAGISLGTRKVWLLFDLLILGSSAVVVAWASTGLSRLRLERGAEESALIAIVLTLIAFLVASAVSVARGGVGLAWAARLQSLTLWPLIAVALIGQGLYNHWYLRPNLEDMESLRVLSAPSSGPWIELTGPVRGRHGREAQFLFNTKSGRSIHIGWNRFGPSGSWKNGFWHWSNSPDWPRVSYSGNGKVAAWIARDAWPRSQTPFLYILRLDESSPQSISAPLQNDGIVAFSPEGSHCAVVSKNRIVVLRAQDTFLEVAINLADLPSKCDDAYFIGENTLRCEERSEDGKIADFDLREKSWSAVEKPPARSGGEWAVLSPSGETLVNWVREPGKDSEITFADAHTGEVKSRLTGKQYGSWKMPAFLSEDRVAVFDGWRLELSILSSDGQLIQQTDVGQHPVSSFVLVGPETLIFNVRSDRYPDRLVLLAINLPTGHIRKVARDLEPVLPLLRGSWWPQSHQGRLIVPEPGSPTSKLYYGRKVSYDHFESLVFFDMENGERRVLLKPASSLDASEEAKERDVAEVAKEKRSGNEMIALCSALGDVVLSEELWSEDRWPFTDLPEYASAEEVIAALDLSGSLQLSPTDRYGNPFEIWISPEPLADRVMRVRSAGPDGVLEECPWDDNTVGIPDCYGDDIVWADGFFVNYPAGAEVQ